MTGLGLAAIAAAVVNYRRAKQKFDALQERIDGIRSAVTTAAQAIWVDWYSEHRLDQFYNRELKEIENAPLSENDMPEGVLVTTLLRVGNLVGQFFRAEPTVILTNTSKNRVFVHAVSVLCSVLGYKISLSVMDGLTDVKNLKQDVIVDRWLKPGKTMDITIGKGVTGLIDPEDGTNHNEDLRKIICEAAGKKLITSCPKLSVSGTYGEDDTKIESATIVLYWNNENKAPYKTAYWNGMPGTLRYVGEAFL